MIDCCKVLNTEPQLLLLTQLISLTDFKDEKNSVLTWEAAEQKHFSNQVREIAIKVEESGNIHYY